MDARPSPVSAELSRAIVDGSRAHNNTFRALGARLRLHAALVLFHGILCDDDDNNGKRRIFEMELNSRFTIPRRKFPSGSRSAYCTP